MDEIFGGSGVGSAPLGTIVSIPLFPSQAPSETALIRSSTVEEPCEDQQPVSSTATHTTSDWTKKGRPTVIS